MAKIALSALVLATASAVGFMYALPKDVKALVDAGHAEMNSDPTAANPANAKEFPVRATPAGIAANEAAPATETVAPTFAFITGPALERPARGAGRKHKYPFADFPAPLNGVTTKIFVPATEKMPDPAKSLSSTVSSASKEYATVTSQKPGKNKKGEMVMKNQYDYARKFALSPGELDGVKGAYIERVK